MDQSKLAFAIMKRFLFGTVLILICSLSGVAWSGPPDYWPTEAWRTSTPEEQGMNSDVLADMLSRIMDHRHSIDSVTVIRNGYLVLDAYLYPFQKNTKHLLHSCTKSITSTLVGIAIDKGYIKNVNRSILDFFPEITPANMIVEKSNIRLKNVLTMATGLECRDSSLYNWEGLFQMWKSENWNQYMLDLPLVEAPGTRFEYCNGATYLLSAIIQKTTGMRSLEFARNNLFDPLGITDVYWLANPQGIDIGMGGMWLKPHDMAKFGWLFLNKGEWDSKTIVSEEWVDAATQGHIKADFFDQYGYQWWIDNDGYYVAVGYGGQRIFVVPKVNLVVVFTSFNAVLREPDILLKSYIIKAVESDLPLPANVTAKERLEALVKKCQAPPTQDPIPKQPAIAQVISGKKYKIDTNKLGYRYFIAHFDPKQNAAIIEYDINNKQFSFQVEMDNVYRTIDSRMEKTTLNDDYVAMCGSQDYVKKGQWLNEDTFEYSYLCVGDTEEVSVDIKFTGNDASILIFVPWGDNIDLKGTKD